ncbi:hypothetical protein [Streptomyces hawaiiensis]|uniref:hypothetical protein n=1 Tax=Streptomyces hawaiiensis TaxID=67305 RepID=UPI003CCC8E76
MTFQRHRGLTEQAADAAVDQACRMLRLPTIRAQIPDLAEAAARDHHSPPNWSTNWSRPRTRRY